jgi:hypothetical protein
VAVSLAIGVAFGVFFYLATQDDTVLTFTYQVELVLNGTGEVRVSLPIPVPEAQFGRLVITPVSTTIFFNRSGAEPALDVTLRDRTWINATSAVRWEFYDPVDADLTQTDPSGPPCTTACFTGIALAVVSGDVTSVRVRMNVSWSGGCEAHYWSLDSSVPPGVHAVTGAWDTPSC